MRSKMVLPLLEQGTNLQLRWQVMAHKILQQKDIVIVPHIDSPHFKDIAGQVFGLQKAIGYAGKQGSKCAWFCQCTGCGVYRTVTKNNLRIYQRNGNAGCDCGRRGHHAVGSSTYSSWVAMKTRCANPKNTNFKHYGGRGIFVCDRWKDSFAAFYEDMGERPENHSIDRIDVNKGYSPENCRWATI